MDYLLWASGQGGWGYGDKGGGKQGKRGRGSWVEVQGAVVEGAGSRGRGGGKRGERGGGKFLQISLGVRKNLMRNLPTRNYFASFVIW